jgi:hypothetical protein
MISGMRLVLCSVVVALLAAPALAASVDPSALALRQADVPAGFTLDRSESGVRTNAVEAKESPEAGRFFARWHRVTGYQTVWERRERRIEARADVFASAEGSQKLLEWADRQLRLAGIKGLERERVRIGAGGWRYRGGADFGTVVIWRYRHVWAGVGGRLVAPALTLDIARKQQRRIEAALR